MLALVAYSNYVRSILSFANCLEMTRFAFVTKEARQYLKYVKNVQEYDGDTFVEQRLGPVEVFCFKGNYIVAELNSFIADLAESAGEAPPAQGYFKHFHNGIEVFTGGLSIQN